MKKLKVGIVITKNTPEYVELSLRFKQAVENIGDKATLVPHCGDLGAIDDCDIVFQSAYPHYRGANVCQDELELPIAHECFIADNEWRIKVHYFAYNHQQRSMFIDRGPLHLGGYYQCGFDHIKNFGQYYNQKVPIDRYEKLEIKLYPYRKTTSDRVLVFGQVRYGIGTQGIDIYDWYKLLQNQHNILNRMFPSDILPEFEIRKHVNDHTLCGYKVSEIKKLYEDILNSRLTISYNSNAAIESMILGVPTVCMNKMSMLYPDFHWKYGAWYWCSDHMRIKILSRISYTQWKPEEFEDMWLHLREGHLNEKV
jgi:hypothetical protein